MRSQVLDALGSCVRSIIAAPENRTFVVSDLSSIEVWVLGWLTRCEGINRMAREKRDPYKSFGEVWLGTPYDSINKSVRRLCKPPMLGCGYRLGPGQQVGPDEFIGLMAYGRSMGIEMSQEQAEHATQVYREKFFEVVNWWYWWEDAACRTVLQGSTVEGFGLRFQLEGDFMTILLPSGRKLWYHKPRWEQVRAPWGDLVWNFTYMGKHQKTQQWCRLTNHGGRGVEQTTQGIARDVLVHGMRMFEEKAREQLGPQEAEIVGHVHDEAIVETRTRCADQTLSLLDQCLSTTPSWAPGLILGSEGYVAKRYRKG